MHLKALQYRYLIFYPKVAALKAEHTQKLVILHVTLKWLPWKLQVEGHSLYPSSPIGHGVEGKTSFWPVRKLTYVEYMYSDPSLSYKS